MNASPCRDQSQDLASADAVWDVKRDLKSILSCDLSCSTNFSVSRGFSDAPNPVLELEGHGMISLPLGSHDANAIRSCAQQHRFTIRGEPLVEDLVQNPWEVDAARVRFCNPSWSLWMGNIVREVCATLGIDFEPSRHRCTFQKLILYGPGSYRPPFIDTDWTGSTFATILVALPSKFDGGAARFSYGGESTVHDCSPSSLIETSVMAWYTKVAHEFKPITRGCRLALAFRLVCMFASLAPTLPDKTAVIERLEHLFELWAQDKNGDSPEKVVYLLEHEYPEADLCRNTLAGLDARLLGMLQDPAKHHGVHLGLANVTCKVVGQADISKCCCHSDDESDGDDPEEVKMGDVLTSEILLDTLVDLDGCILAEDVSITGQEAVQDDLVDRIQDGPYTRQEYKKGDKCEKGQNDGQGHCSPSHVTIILPSPYVFPVLTSIRIYRILENSDAVSTVAHLSVDLIIDNAAPAGYRRTVLVIWPKWQDFSIRYGDGHDGFKRACETLRTSTSPAPTPDELEVMEQILQRASVISVAEIIAKVCPVACLWRDASIWVRAVTACDAVHGIASLGVENVYRALLVFDFEDIQDVLETALTRDPSNTARFQWLDQLEDWMASQRSDKFDEIIEDWLASQRLKVARSLKPLDEGEYHYMIAICTRGGMAFLRSMLPQIKLVGDPWFLRGFAECLHQEATRFAISHPDGWSHTVKELLWIAAWGADFYNSVGLLGFPPQLHWYSYETPSSEESVNLTRVQLFVGTCLDTKNDDVLTVVFDKLMKFDGLARDEVTKMGKDVLVPLVTSLVSIMRTRLASLPRVGDLCITAASLYVDRVLEDPSLITDAVLSHLLHALALADQPSLDLTVFSQTATPHVNLQSLIVFYEKLDDNHGQLLPLDAKGVHVVRKRLVKRYAKQTRLPDGTSEYNTTVGIKLIIDALHCCLRMEVEQGCSIILGRVLNPTLLKDTYNDSILVPLIPELCKLATRHQQSVTSLTFAAIFHKILTAWIDRVLGPKPADSSAKIAAILQWTCKCSACITVRTFLTAKRPRTLRWSRMDASAREHVESFLRKHASSGATWKTDQSSPEVFSVTKTESIAASVRWLVEQRNGASMLANITKNTTEMRYILGSDYSRISEALKVAPTPAPGQRPDASSKSTSAGALQVSQNLRAALSAHPIFAPTIANRSAFPNSPAVPAVRTAAPTAVPKRRSETTPFGRWTIPTPGTNPNQSMAGEPARKRRKWEYGP
ncbi:hypothetical protein B0H21DRAFT_894199 [Amylocystis lapponica]|nr:hypothetical protein B0H21DRAFT_894199 [Amylocystis lapponica]